MKASLFLALSAVWIPLAAQAIVNGRFATAPFLKGVVKVNDDCTGALIGNKCVLTAHHCLAKNRLGEVMLPEFKDSVVMESTKKIKMVSSFEPGYSDKRCYDLQIAVLAQPHNLGYNLTKNSVQGQSVAVAGWGFLGDYTIPKTLQFLQYTAKAKFVPSEGIVVPVADGATGIIFRDSGGPLFVCQGDKCFVAGVANGKAKGSTLVKTEHLWCDLRSNWAWVTEVVKANCL
ncbi:hypothetical protein KI688_001526 [Linnemannia hyalina]|uniref:Peptidase S1 domain-containing protein n=1 Tax=Linnemannia hyalina TaxID=64524 RepID=A0A9P7XTD2_9FUNG|nr:hypothetical protein KI688_001526 [Linnemannia hyalina]